MNAIKFTPKHLIDNYQDLKHSLLSISTILLLTGLSVFFSHTLVADEPAQRINVTAASADVMLGTKKLGSVSKDQEFDVLSQSGSWYQIEFQVNGKLEKGWIKEKDVRVVQAQSKKPDTTKPEAANSDTTKPETTKPEVAKPNLTPPPDQPKWLMVTNDNSPLKIGQETVATLRRNQVFPIASRNGSWLQVRIFEDGALTSGYINETQCRILEARDIGPALNGKLPASITEATLQVDWKTRELIIKGAIPIQKKDQLAVMSADGSAQDPTATIESEENGITIRMTGTDWTKVIPEGTRSLWIIEGTSENPKWHRIDLPSVEIGAEITATKYPNFDEGLVINIPASGLLPGFVVEHAYQFSNQTPTQIEALSTAIGSLPRVADVSTGTGKWPQSLRVVVPYANSKDEALTHLVLIRRPDGSVSQAIQFQRKGDIISGVGKQIKAALPALVDTTVKAPSVELLDANEAVALIKATGLKPLLIDQSTYQRIDLAKLPKSMILRQGIPPGESLLTGSELVLSTSSDNGSVLQESFQLLDDSQIGLLSNPSESPPAADNPQLDAPQLSNSDNNELNNNPSNGNIQIFQGGGLLSGSDLDQATLENNAGIINAGDELNFIEPQNTGLISGNDGLNGLVNPNLNPNSGLISDDGSLDLENENLNGDQPNSGLDIGGLNPDPTLPNPLDGLVIPINPDPGISLDPLSEPEKVLLTGILKIIIAAILNQPDPNALPGPIGAAITLAIQAEEQKLLDAKDAATEFESVQRIFDLVLNQLNLSLTDAQKTAALEAWTTARQHAAHRPLDKNNNSVMADDVVLFFVIWLQQQNLFNPASQIVISPNGMGNTVAVLPANPVSPDWIKDLLAMLQPGQPLKPIIPPPPPGPISPPIDPLASLPNGSPVIEAGDGPDLVKVPNVQDLVIENAKKQLDELGLIIGNLKDLFSSDKILESSLKEGEWVKPGTSMTLRVLRQVPDLKLFTVKDGKNVLTQNKLTCEVDGKHSLTDIIVEQRPKAGEYIDPQESIHVDVAMLAPDVVGAKLSDASKTLSDRDLKWESATKAFQVDKVVEQKPKAGALVRHGQALDLVLHLPVPSIIGMTLDKAKALAQEWDLDLTLRNERARNNDIVRGQTPAAQTYAPHRSGLSAGPIVMKVPDVRGLSIERAEQELAAEDLNTSRVGDLLRSDRVTLQSPNAGEEKERGTTIQLDARVRLPNYVGSDLLRARDAIRGQEGQLRVNVSGLVGSNDVVYSQNPRGDSLVSPRTEVILIPGVNVPRLTGLTPVEADRALQRAGLEGQIVSSGTQDTDRDELDGKTVISGQDPPAGLHRRDQVGRINLAATQYKLALVKVPEVRQMSMSAAIQRLNAVGLKVILEIDGQRFTQAQYTARALIDILGGTDRTARQEPYVYEQNPEPGTEVKKGTTVTISDSPRY